MATKLIDNCNSDRCPVEVYLHTVVLIALHGASVEPVVEDVAAIETHAPFPVMRRPLQLGIHPEYGTYVVNTLYCLRLKEQIQNEAQVLGAAKFYGCCAAKDNRQFFAVEGKVEEMAVFVVLVGACGKHVAVEPFPALNMADACNPKLLE